MYKLSKTAKMPAKSFSLPAHHCKVGSILRKVEGSVCAKCYAMKGKYRFPSTQKLREDNYTQYTKNPTLFTYELADIIQREYLKTGLPLFRWFDSGDLIDEYMLLSIIKIASILPHITFWLPTKEYTILDKVCKDLHDNDNTLPSNLNIRLSVYLIDGKYFELPEHMSGVNQTRVISKSNPSPVEDEQICYGNCVSCNYKCWESTCNVAYVEH